MDDQHGEKRHEEQESPRTPPPITVSTLSNMQSIRRRSRGRHLRPGTRSIIFDNNCQGYGWLLPGWLAEERHMESGRVYRYYYDPSGRLYRSQHEVLHAWEQVGIVVLDI